MTMKRLAILGSTGSIGTQTLDVARSHPELFQVTVLAANTSDVLLEKQIEEFCPSLAVLADEKPEVWMLVNNSGCGFLGNVGEGELEKQTQMVELNLKGLTAMTHLVIPYMPSGAHIINVSSIASFCPNARMTVYSATKSYVTAFTFGIGEERYSVADRAHHFKPAVLLIEGDGFVLLGAFDRHMCDMHALPPFQAVRKRLR